MPGTVREKLARVMGTMNDVLSNGLLEIRQAYGWSATHDNAIEAELVSRLDRAPNNEERGGFEWFRQRAETAAQLIDDVLTNLSDPTFFRRHVEARVSRQTDPATEARTSRFLQDLFDLKNQPDASYEDVLSFLIRAPSSRAYGGATRLIGDGNYNVLVWLPDAKLIVRAGESITQTELDALQAVESEGVPISMDDSWLEETESGRYRGFIVMREIEGAPLKDFLAEGVEQTTMAERLELTRSIGEESGKALTHGFVPLDNHAGNVMVGWHYRDGTRHLKATRIDYGLAESLNSQNLWVEIASNWMAFIARIMPAGADPEPFFEAFKEGFLTPLEAARHVSPEHRARYDAGVAVIERLAGTVLNAGPIDEQWYQQTAPNPGEDVTIPGRTGGVPDAEAPTDPTQRF